MRLLVLAAIIAAATAAETVPDPYGLGQRLALISLLQERYGITPEPGLSEAELRALWQAQQATPTTPDQAVEADRRRRIIDRLRHLEITIDDNASTEALTALLAQAERNLADQAGVGTVTGTAPRPEPTATDDDPPATAPATDDPLAGIVLPEMPTSIDFSDDLDLPRYREVGAVTKAGLRARLFCDRDQPERCLLAVHNQADTDIDALLAIRLGGEDIKQLQLSVIGSGNRFRPPLRTWVRYELSLEHADYELVVISHQLRRTGRRSQSTIIGY